VRFGPPPDRDQNVFLCYSPNYRGFVVAGAVFKAEDEEEDGAPSALMPYVRIVFDPDNAKPAGDDPA
jgi:hypothetical protein